MHPRYALPLRMATNALLLLLSLLGLFGLGEAGVRHLQSSGRLPDYALAAQEIGALDLDLEGYRSSWREMIAEGQASGR